LDHPTSHRPVVRIPSQYLIPFIASNIAAIVFAWFAWNRPRSAAWLCAAVFAWASITNATFAIRNPAVYVDYAPLAIIPAYRVFINGWFSTHVRWMVLPIAAGQLAISGLLLAPKPWRMLGVAGAIAFLAGIAPLGVGSAFPFSIWFGAAVVLSARDGVRVSRTQFPSSSDGERMRTVANSK
jgi:hypothetical protein